MPVQSAGLLVYKRAGSDLFVFLVHPGGPFWAKRDLGAWSIPKGEIGASEDTLNAAKREFHEETGQSVDGIFTALPPCRLPSRKIVHAFAIESEIDAGAVRSNPFDLEWPPKSGRRQSFPEIDRGAWFGIAEARQRLQPGQLPLLDALCRLLGVTPAP